MPRRKPNLTKRKKSGKQLITFALNRPLQESRFSAVQPRSVDLAIDLGPTEIRKPPSDIKLSPIASSSYSRIFPSTDSKRESSSLEMNDEPQISQESSVIRSTASQARESQNFMKVLKRHGIPADAVEREIHRIKDLPIRTEHIMHIKEDYFHVYKKRLKKIFEDVPSYRYAIMENGVLYFNGDCMKDIMNLSENLDKNVTKNNQSSKDVPPTYESFFYYKSNRQIHAILERRGYFIGDHSLKEISLKKANIDNRKNYRAFVSILLTAADLRVPLKEKMIIDTDHKKILLPLDIPEKNKNLLDQNKSLSKRSVAELIEIALQLDVDMFSHLPKEWQNPGVAGLCAFRLLADELQMQAAVLTPEVTVFLEQIESISESAIQDLKAEGPKAFIKPKINKLFEFAGGFKLENYSPAQVEPIKQSIEEAKLSVQGQLIYRKQDGRFFVLIDNAYINIPQKLYGNKDYPKAAISQAHFTVNDGMSKAASEPLFEKYKKTWGISEKPIYKIDNADIVYINKTVTFSIIGAYQGIPKTNSRMAGTHQLKINSPELDALAEEDGLRCPFPGYTHHITFAEQSRKAHPALTALGLITEHLNKSDRSRKLKSLLGDIAINKELPVTLKNQETAEEMQQSSSASSYSKENFVVKAAFGEQKNNNGKIEVKQPGNFFQSFGVKPQAHEISSIEPVADLVPQSHKIGLTTQFFSAVQESKNNLKPCIVLDIDDTLASVMSKSDAMCSYFLFIKEHEPQRIIDISVAGEVYPHLLHQGVLEFIRYLVVNGYPFAFFSSAIHERNIQFKDQLLKQALTAEQCKGLKDIPVCSRNELVAMGQKEQNSYIERIFYGNRKKSLREIINRFKDLGTTISQDRIILVEDDRSYAMPGEQYNLLKIAGCDASDFQPIERGFLNENFTKYNHIFYVLGIIHEMSVSKASPVQTLRALQFKEDVPLEPDSLYKPFAANAELIKDRQFYEKGLKLLQELNPKLDFLTQDNYNLEVESTALQLHGSASSL